ncbi:MAG: DUF1028 domain-containing protein, partial [Candidatus Carbobacillus sp.]|nr:DUF1028 domain-containing protein [Candidatus Carbobacillus sp.]
MTYSIVAFDPMRKEVGVAVASKFLAVGSIVPWVKAGVGAVATQAWANPQYGPDGLRLLEEGYDAEEVVRRLVEHDDEREVRQVGVVDVRGGSATFTGTATHAWAGGYRDTYMAVQGNILAGEGVIDAMVKAFKAAHGSLQRRLFAALLAGDEAGGDRRGKQSAALLVARPQGGYGGISDIACDLRVDDHSEPVRELGRLLDLHELYLEKTAPEDVVEIDASLKKELVHLLRALSTDHGLESDPVEDGLFYQA